MGFFALKISVIHGVYQDNTHNTLDGVYLLI